MIESSTGQHVESGKSGESTQQEPVSVAFQGERGAFSDEAVKAYFGKEAEPFPLPQFCRCLPRRCLWRESNMAWYPSKIHRRAASTMSMICCASMTCSSLAKSAIPSITACSACQDNSFSDIKRVISHPQALAQSDAYLRELGVEIVATYDTAGSAKMIREENLQGVAAVAGKGAAELYQLEILADGIQTIKDNYTRFIALSREPAPRAVVPRKRCWSWRPPINPARSMLPGRLGRQQHQPAQAGIAPFAPTRLGIRLLPRL